MRYRIPSLYEWIISGAANLVWGFCIRSKIPVYKVSNMWDGNGCIQRRPWKKSVEKVIYPQGSTEGCGPGIGQERSGQVIRETEPKVPKGGGNSQGSLQRGYRTSWKCLQPLPRVGDSKPISRTENSFRLDPEFISLHVGEGKSIFPKVPQPGGGGARIHSHDSLAA